MTQFAQPLEARFEEALRQLGNDVKMLKNRVAPLESGCLVVCYIGTIPSGYSSGNPTVVLATGVTLGPLQYNAGYTPHAGDTVLLVPVGQTYIVACALA